MFGDTIGMAEAGLITLFSMAIVFIALLAISFILDLFRIFISDDAVAKRKANKSKEEVMSLETVESVIINEEDDAELVAIITAAIAATLGKSSDTFVVRNIVRTSDVDIQWARAGRMELMR